jgi:hypothetical protein
MEQEEKDKKSQIMGFLFLAMIVGLVGVALFGMDKVFKNQRAYV